MPLLSREMCSRVAAAAENLQGNSREIGAGLQASFFRLLLVTRHVPPQSRTGVAAPSVSSKPVRCRWTLQLVPGPFGLGSSRIFADLGGRPRCIMGRCNLPFYYKRLSAEDQRTFDRWLQANAIFGSIYAVVFIAMAFAGSKSIAPRNAAVAGGSFEVGASEQHRTRTEVVTTHGPPMRLKTFGPSVGHPFAPPTNQR